MKIKYAIETHNVTRKFGNLSAVNRVNVKIKDGELFGLIGPNGAGKTTFIHMLCTILSPTYGTAKVWGIDVKKNPDEIRKLIGIVFQDPTLDSRLTGRENLDFHGMIYGMGREHRERRIGEVLKLVELDVRADSLVDTYSGGMRRRLEVARGLMHNPKILFLDEPTLGLDPQTRRHVWEYIRSLKEKNITIVLTTHYMDEADYLCERVGIMDNGRILVIGEPEKLKDKLEGDAVSLEVTQPERYASSLRKTAYIHKVKVVGETLHLTVNRGERCIPQLIKVVERRGGKVKSVGLRGPTLEDVFMHYTGRSIREEQTGTLEENRLRMRAWTRR